MEDLVVLGLAKPEQPRSDHVIGHFEGIVGCEPCGDIDECNDRRCCK